MWRYVLLVIMIFFVLFCGTMMFESMEAGPTSKIEQHIDEIKKKKKERVSTYATSMRDGMLRGFLGGLLTGNYEGMVSGALSYGLINPVFKYLE